MARISAPLITIGSLWCLPAVTHSFSSASSSALPKIKNLQAYGGSINDERFIASPPSTSPNILAKNHGPPFSIHLRPATMKDLDTVLQWDEQEHLQDEEKMGDAEYNDWNWEFELARDANNNVVEWRHTLIAEYQEETKNNNKESSDGRSALMSPTPIGIVQVLDPSREETQYWGNDGRNPEYIDEFCRPELRAIDIWIGVPEYLGRGIGTRMMQLALRDYCFDDPTVQAVLVDPMATHHDAIRFYQNKCGFEPVGLRTFGPDTCLVHKLEREKWESGPLTRLSADV